MYICISFKRFAAVLACGMLAVCAFVIVRQRVSTVPTVGQMVNAPVIVLDAGHGGEDGGAVSPNGVKESGINLSITQRLADLLRFCGEHVVMVRSDDCSLSDSGATVHDRKASDLQNRVKIVNAQPQAVLLSIHQNSLPTSPVTHGAQAFWNEQAGANVLAERIQVYFNECINDRQKVAKKISSQIYLMKHAQAPAVLLECGFLSNAADTQKLQQQDHQTLIATAIAAGYFSIRGELS